MKKILPISIILFALGCKTPKVKDLPGGNEMNVTSPKDQKKYPVSGTVTYSNSYCGGARPTDKILQELTSPKPFSNQMFYIREGKENDINNKIIDSVKTDENGNFSTLLPSGEYVIIEKNRKDKTYYQNVLQKHGKDSPNYTAVDTVCLDSWLKNSLFQFTLAESELKNISWNMHTGCFFSAPCVNYTGPYPP